MSVLRRHLSQMLWGWMLIQCVAIAAPVALAAADVASRVDVLCDCPGTEHGATCPMHHGPSSTPVPHAPCSFSGAHSPADVALLSLAGGIGVVRLLCATDIAPDSTELVERVAGTPGSLRQLPDSPPPRA